MPAGSERGGHAHKELQQFIVAISGSFEIFLKDGDEMTLSINSLGEQKQKVISSKAI